MATPLNNKAMNNLTNEREKFRMIRNALQIFNIFSFFQTSQPAHPVKHAPEHYYPKVIYPWKRAVQSSLMENGGAA